MTELNGSHPSAPELPAANDAPPAEPPNQELRKMQVNILMAELDQRFSEMRDYNVRYQQAMLLYLSALGAAIGLTASGKLTVVAIRQYPDAPVIVFLFIALNFLVIFHGVTLSSWSMSYAKYNSVFLGPRIAKLAELKDGAVEFDRWGSDIKEVAVRARSLGYMMWFALVIITCLGSLTLADFGRYWRTGLGPKALLVAAAITLPSLLFLTLHTGFSEAFMTQQFANPEPPDVRARVWIYSATSTLIVLVAAGCILLGQW